MNASPQSSDHIVKSYDDELKRLTREIQRMGEIALAQLDGAIDAVMERDSDAAMKIVQNDSSIDMLEHEVSNSRNRPVYCSSSSSSRAHADSARSASLSWYAASTSRTSVSASRARRGSGARSSYRAAPCSHRGCWSTPASASPSCCAVMASR